MKFLKYGLKFFLILLMSSIFLSTANAMIERYDQPDKIIIVNSLSPQFEIIQSANATTGYSWVLRNYDKKLLTLVESHYIPSKSQLAGSGGKMLWAFKATPKAFEQSGTETKILLTYARSWAPNDNPTSVEFKVVFKKAGEDEVRIMS